MRPRRYSARRTPKPRHWPLRLRASRADGTTHIAKIEVDRLVDEVTRALPDPSTFAEAGHVRATSHPGNVAEAVDDVYWWDLRPTRLDLTPTWTQAELGALSAVGVELPTAEQRLLGEQRAWLRPVLNCRRRLVLVVHDEDGAGRHPLWGRIEEQLRTAGSKSASMTDCCAATPTSLRFSISGRRR